MTEVDVEQLKLQTVIPRFNYKERALLDRFVLSLYCPDADQRCLKRKWPRNNRHTTL